MTEPKFQVGDLVESLHNGIKPTGIIGRVIQVHQCSNGCHLVVQTDGDTEGPAAYGHENYFQLVDEHQLCSFAPSKGYEDWKT